MFEDMTYEYILADMLGRVTSDVDKREGSVIYDAVAPCAYQLAQAYFNLNNYIDLFYVDTSMDEYLDRKAADYGITRKAASYSVRRVEATGAIDVGTRWGIGETTYKIIEVLGTDIYSAVCEQPGETGNAYNGVMENIDNINGVTAVLTDIIAAGANEESDDSLRNRIKQYLTIPYQNGNTAQYLKWATDFEGVGTAKVFPLWAGGNTLKIAITNGQYLPAEASLTERFQEYIDPGSTGLGNGAAPVGCKVVVAGGTQLNIAVSGSIILAEGYSEAEGAAGAIADYLASITYAKSSVSYMKIGSVLLDCPSIADLSDLTVNEGITDIPMAGDEIPVLNSLNLVVAEV